jgi:hypothetical protein
MAAERDELEGCRLEAERADDYAAALSFIREKLPSYWNEISLVIRELRDTADILRNIYNVITDSDPRRIGDAAEDLSLVLLSLQKTLIDMGRYIGDADVSYLRTWRELSRGMSTEADMSLERRLHTYFDFLTQVRLFMTR